MWNSVLSKLQLYSSGIAASFYRNRFGNYMKPENKPVPFWRISIFLYLKIRTF
jgi:hypothetical protein